MLTSIEIEGFRCIEHAKLDFDQQFTGIIGPNASGKTSLLEAIYFLGHGRSFRAQRRETLLKTGADYFRVVGRVESSRGPLVAGMEYRDGSTQAHLAGAGVSAIAEIAQVLPIQVIDPGVHRLVEEGSSRRRRNLDWGVFHVKHEFLGWWRRYQRALQQRNAALRSQEAAQLIHAWEPELALAGAAVDACRREYVELLKPHFDRLTSELLGVGVGISYRRGWAADEELGTALVGARERDLKSRTTSVGAHRADLAFSINRVAARDRVSRGQQKMLAAAFVLAQVALRAQQPGPRTTLMLDDPAAELDVDNLGKLLAAVSRIPSQLVVTSVSEAGIRGMPDGRVFHVEQGHLRRMI